MNASLSVADLSVHPGQRIADRLCLTVAGVEVDLPLFLLNGTHPGPTFVLTAGIHGGEYPCVEAAARLGQTLDPADLHGQLIILPSANPIAFASRSIFITPIDGKNLNRVFPGNPDGTFTEAWAYWLFNKVMRQADYYIDLHGGDMVEALVPFVAYTLTGNPEVDEPARAMGRIFGIRAVLQNNDPGGLGGATFAAAARAGIPALLAEAGGQGVWNESDVGILHAGVRRVLAHFGMYPPIEDSGEPIELLTGWAWLRAKYNGVFYPNVTIGANVMEGQDLGRIADLFGNTLQSITAPASGEILFLLTSLAINDGDPIMAIAYA